MKKFKEFNRYEGYKKIEALPRNWKEKSYPVRVRVWRITEDAGKRKSFIQVQALMPSLPALQNFRGRLE